MGVGLYKEVLQSSQEGNKGIDESFSSRPTEAGVRQVVLLRWEKEAMGVEIMQGRKLRLFRLVQSQTIISERGRVGRGD